MTSQLLFEAVCGTERWTFGDYFVGIGAAYDAFHHKRYRVFPRRMRLPARSGDPSNPARHHRPCFRR